MQFINQTNEEMFKAIEQRLKYRDNIHIVCLAWVGYTHLHMYANHQWNLSLDAIINPADRANNEHLTTTLFPEANISILPVDNSQRNAPEGLYSLTDVQLKECLLKVFEFNSEQIRSEEIYFSLEGWYCNYQSLLETLKTIIDTNQIADKFVRTVYISCTDI